MFARYRNASHASRGQAMVEFAIILPLLALLLVLAVDFGRVFFGWVGLHNASRIAANEAARRPGAWDVTPDPAGQNRFRELVERDLEAMNCVIDRNGNGDETDDIPDPVYTNRAGTADPHELGDLVQVDLECDFRFLTPIAGLIMGNPLTISASSHFTVFGGTVMGIPVGEEPPTSECLDNEVPNLEGLTVGVARDVWTTYGFDAANFTPDASAGRDDETVLSQNTTPSSVPGDCLVATATVVVSSEEPEVCTSPEIAVPNFMGMTVQDARDDWEALFTGTFSPASGFDTEIVDGQSLTGCAEPDEDITVEHSAAEPPPEPECNMPQLVNQKVSNARTMWATAGFDPANFTALAPTSGNNPDYKIGWQSLVGGFPYLCSSSVTVAQQQPAP